MLHLDEIFYNPAKHALKDGKKLLGAWLQTASPFAAEIFSKAGLDVLIIDMEHGPNDILSLIEQLRAIQGFHSVPFVRAPWNDPVIIKRILDAGAYGVLIPSVSTVEEARAAVAACKYPPMGIRGIAPSPRAPGYGMNSRNYLDHANDEVLVMTAVETPSAVENLDEMLKVEGLDGIFIGPMDLATSMGHFCDPDHPEVQEAIHTIEAKVNASGKFLASIVGNMDIAKAKFDAGYQLVVAMADGSTLGNAARKNVDTFHSFFPEQ